MTDTVGTRGSQTAEVAGAADRDRAEASPADRLALDVETGLEATLRVLTDHLRTGQDAATAMAPAYGALWAALAELVGGG